MADTPHPRGGVATPSRRRVLKTAAVAGGALWVAPAVDSFVTGAAAASGSTTVPLNKITNGNNQDPPLSDTCTAGGVGPGRGSATFTRTENPATISVTITLSTGTNITGRDVHILQSNGSTCLGGTATAVGTWAASPQQGPQSFSTAIVSGATHFVVALVVSGGAGNDGYASTVANLP